MRRRKRVDISPMAMDSSLSSAASTKKSRHSNVTAGKVRTKRLNDASLDVGGHFKCRLDTTLDHLPVKTAGTNSRCALHKWVNIETQKQVMFCPTCNVNLCLSCYRLFHTKPNLLQMKESLSNKYNHQT